MPEISPVRLEELRGLIQSGEVYKFYSWIEWRRVRQIVLAQDRRECQICKAAGRYRRGVIVHHIRHLDQRPDLALSVVDPNTGERQLVTVCKACHEAQHPESLRQSKSSRQSAPTVTPERWD